MVHRIKYSSPLLFKSRHVSRQKLMGSSLPTTCRLKYNIQSLSLRISDYPNKNMLGEWHVTILRSFCWKRGTTRGVRLYLLEIVPFQTMSIVCGTHYLVTNQKTTAVTLSPSLLTDEVSQSTLSQSAQLNLLFSKLPIIKQNCWPLYRTIPSIIQKHMVWAYLISCNAHKIIF